MSKRRSIFISYRRSDSADASGRLYDRLIRRFGRERIFKDVDSIPYGRDFRRHIEKEVSCCQVMLVIIGREWLNVVDEAGNRRLEQVNDWVRLEIEAGLRQSDVLVIPVLIGEARCPSPEALPDSLKGLAYLNCANVRSDPDFHRDVDRLIKKIEADKLPGILRSKVVRRSVLPVGGMVAFLLVTMMVRSNNQISIPDGTYRKTCMDIDERNDTLFATCGVGNGQWNETSLTLTDCEGGIENINGSLQCNPNQIPDGPYDIPDGPYRKTCSDIQIGQNDTLYANCLTVDQQSQHTVLENFTDCRAIENNNGSLQCF